MEPRTRGVERELADRDPHAAGALIAQAEDALAIADDDDLDAVEPRVRPDGRAAVKVDEAVDGVDELLVTAEPSGGSMSPTSDPVVKATLT